MLSYSVYKLLHYFGMFLIFTAVGGVTVHAAGGGDKESNPARRALAVSHGIGLLLMAVAGFGMLAQIGVSAMGGWLWAKIIIWLVLGAATVLPYKARSLAGAMLMLVPLLGALAAYLAIYKPF